MDSSPPPIEKMTVTSGDVSVTFDPSAFPEDVVPVVAATSPAESPFVAEFGLPSGSGDLAAATVTAPTQPSEEVEIAFQLDVAALPDGAVPAIFYLDEYTQLWLPIPSAMEPNGRLVGRTDHFTSFMAGLTTVLEGLEKGAQWLRFQVAKGVGARTGAPACNGEPPGWILGLEADDGLNAPMRVCAEAGDGDALVLHVAVNRAYSLAVSGPVAPSSTSWQPSTDTASLLYQTLGDDSAWAGGGAVLAPARVETLLTWPDGSLPAGEVLIEGRVTPGSAFLDTVVAALELLVGYVERPETMMLEAVSCLQAAVDLVGDGWVEAPGSLADATQECLGPVQAAATGAAAASAKRLLIALDVSLMLGRGAQTALDASAALNEPHSVTVLVLGVVDPPPVGSVLLSDVRTGFGGAGPSGRPVDVVIGSLRAGSSSTQWVGCEGTPAWGEYAMGDGRRLTGLLGKRDYTPSSLTFTVRILVDGAVVDSFTIGNEPIPIDTALPPGETLRLEAQLLDGTCTGAPDGYLVWGNGALS